MDYIYYKPINKDISEAADSSVNLLLFNYTSSANVLGNSQPNILRYLFNDRSYFPPVHNSEEEVVKITVNFIVKFVRNSQLESQFLEIQKIYDIPMLRPIIDNPYFNLA